MPGSLEEYYQEAGRGGRDEKKAFAVALCSSTDSAKLKKRLADEFPDKEFIYRVYEALGNYYQIAVGYGLDTVHDFSLTDFCSAYKFSLLQAHHALKILGLSIPRPGRNSGTFPYPARRMRNARSVSGNGSRRCWNISTRSGYAVAACSYPISARKIPPLVAVATYAYRSMNHSL